MIPTLRPMELGDVEMVAELWHQAYWQGHAGLVPEKLAKYRDRAVFSWRAAQAVEHAVVAETADGIVGFVSWKADELDQIFITSEARGTGLADRMMAVDEAKIAEVGFKQAYLECVAGNDRAYRFYEKSGWRDMRAENYPADTPDGPVEVLCHRFVKRVAEK